MNFLKNMKVVRVANSATAGTSDVTTSVIDRTGFESVCFIALLGDVTSGSVLTLTANTNSASSTSSPTPATLTTTATYTAASASDADNKLLVLDLNKPRDKYIFAVLSRATQNAVVDGVIAILYNGRLNPVSVGASVIASAFANDPS